MERSDADRYVSTGLADLNAQQSWTANTRDMARSDADRPLFTGPAGLNVLQNTTGPAGLNVQRPWTITTPQSCTEMHSPLLRSTTSRSQQSSHNYMDEHQGVHPEQVARAGLTQAHTTAEMPNHSTLLKGVPQQQTTTLVPATNICDRKTLGKNRSK